MHCPTLTELPPPPTGKSGWPWTAETSAKACFISEGKPCPRLSIITPSYNQAQFLEETIRSVLLQGYPDLEYWIIDGGSKDGSVDIIKKYEKWLAGWVSERDNGQAEAINKGLRLSKGTIKAYLNSDDAYQPGTLFRVISFFSENNNIDIVYGNFEVINEDRQIRYTNEAPEFDIEKLLMRDYICQPTVFWRNAVHERIGLFREDLHFVMDYEFLLRSAIIGKFRFAKIDGDPIATIKIWHGAKTSNKSDTCLEEEHDVLENIFDHPLMPIELRKLRNKSIAQTYFDFSYSRYLSFDMRAARRVLFQAANINNKLIYRPSCWSLYCKTMLGSRLSLYARNLRWIWRIYRQKKKYLQIQ